jgi:hypothetical protein
LTKRLLAALAVVIAVAGVAAGCSGGKDSSIPRDEFVRKATAICKATARKVDRARANGKATRDDQVTAVATAVLDQVDALRKLGSPSGDADRLDTAYTVYERVFSKWQANPASFPTGTDEPAFVEAQRTLAEFGLDDCTGG